jgi:arabinogalactan oligomer/maltooligosaccharide transport system permease protein
MVIASFFPIIFTIYISMTNFGQGHITSFQFVGLKNFTDIFTNNTGLISLSGFAGIFEWTVAFAAITTALSFAGGLFLANLLNNENMWERNFYRTLLIIPWALPGLIAILAWGAGILQFPYGLMDTFLGQLGISLAQQPQWLLDPFWARLAVFMVGFWLGYPFMMTACLGALQSISPEVLQAAEIDGATPLQKFFRVTLPLLRLATLPLIISTFAYNLNNFGVVYLLTGGGPPVDAYHGATDILPTVVYKFAYADQKYYLACALGVLIFLIIGSFSAVNMKLSGAFQEVGR